MSFNQSRCVARLAARPLWYAQHYAPDYRNYIKYPGKRANVGSLTHFTFYLTSPPPPQHILLAYTLRYAYGNSITLCASKCARVPDA